MTTARDKVSDGEDEENNIDSQCRKKNGVVAQFRSGSWGGESIREARRAKGVAPQSKAVHPSSR